MLLPQAERRDEIRFYIAKSLPYNVRLAISFALIFVGLAVQFGVPDYYLAGLPFIFAGVLFLLTKGFDNKPEQESRLGDWKPTTKEQVKRILDIRDKAKKWDEALVDITNGVGGCSFVLAGLIVAAVAVGVGYHSPILRNTVIADAAVMFLPFWFTGVKFILKNDHAVIKAELFLKVHSLFETIKDEGEEFQFQMRTAGVKDEAGEVPRDLKAIIHFHNGPADFLGLQMQIALNDVQGTSYPYYYCVLVARKELDKLNKKNLGSPPENVVLECKSEKDVEIAVIRQYTTKTSGYHTKIADIKKIFWHALKEARKVTTN